ncbi:hypothetical protein E4P41_13880 [Geodermatophilus sp. DF01-2]|uniref:Mov34/MPN/PAD-1 family protein n=1 Tax=Geodermatophilus sp. DF01-2 TaxID=2559610 RepID=UPI0010739622|nr:Mov34/MPN/PAD-1 family protein [Geodermatophilus sp. DF01_2]TFV57744.1 hypothetical protein E4P41_13880 [Geodermatophilus sp. DF01_2]
MSRVPPTLTNYRVPRAVLDDTGALLRERGLLGFEAVVLWIGRVDSPTEATVLAAVRPGQVAYRSDDGCAVEVPPDALSEIISLLPAETFVLARVHTHPGAAYHSPVDDANMLIAHEGAISIVVPDFARDPVELTRCSVNELRHSTGWRELPPDDVDAAFEVS